MGTKDTRKHFVYQKGQEGYYADVSEIVCFESEGRRVKVVTLTGEDAFYGKISDIYESLDHAFFWQIHQSIIINCSMVGEWNYEAVTMRTGAVLPISQSRRKEIRARVRLCISRKGISMRNGTIKKIMSVMLALVLCVCGSSSAWAASVSESDYTKGGTGGKTLITYTFNCKAYYTTTVDACIIDMKASTGNVVQFSYGQMTTSLKAGGSNTTSLNGESTSASMNSKNWTIVTGNAGKNHATRVTYLKGGQETIYGFKEFKNVEALY